MDPVFQHPDSAHVEAHRVRRAFLQRIEDDPRTALFRSWWIAWAGALHGLYLASGSLWCLLHWKSFAWALPPIASPGFVKAFAIALLFLGAWLMLAVLRGRIRRRTRLLAAWASGLIAVLCGTVALSLPHHATYIVVGAGHALFAITWAMLLIVRRPRARRRSLYRRTPDMPAAHPRT